MLSDVLLRLRALFKRASVEDDIDEELRFHLERQVAAFVQRGLDHDEAVRRARLEFGGLDQIKEEYRDALGVRVIDDLSRDLRVACRSLRATPVVTAVAILSLALAIGANTAIFSIIDSLLLRTLPVQDPAALALITDQAAAPRVRVWGYPIWKQIRERPQLFEATAAWSFTRFNLASGGETQFVDGLWASGSFFATLGVPAVQGRVFSDIDDRRGGGPYGPVAVISYAFWQRHYSGAGDALGRTLRLDGVAFTIVGVTPADFFGPEVGRAFDVIVPLEVEPLIAGSDTRLDNSGSNFLTIIARLRPQQSLELADASLRSAQSQIREATLDWWKSGSPQEIERYLKVPFAVQPAAAGYSALRGRYERPLLILMVVVAVVLLIASMNIANLLLARGTARRHELSVRVALGASRWRLMRQLLIESAVLAGSGAALGLLLALWSSESLVSQLSTNMFLDLSIDTRVLGFTIAITIATTLLFGTAPALRASRVKPVDAIKEEGRTPFTQVHGRLMSSLLVAQVALSIVLVVGAGLFVRSFVLLTTRPLGMRTDQILAATIDTLRTGIAPEQRIPLFNRVLDAVQASPNIEAAAISYVTPLTGRGFTPSVEISGVPLAATSSGEIWGNLVSSDWFTTYGMPLLAGRRFNDGDRFGAPRVAVINQTFARRFFDGQSPLGRTIVLYAGRPTALPPMEIVGVVADAIYTSPRDRVPPTWYAPLDQFNLPTMLVAMRSATLSVRPSSGSPLLLTNSVTAAVATVDPKLTLTFQPLATLLHTSVAQERLMALLASFFGAIALLLAGLGLYGVTAYTASCRRTEIGIRIALGAAPGGVVQLMLKRVALLVGTGAALGIGASFWASKFVATLLHDLEPRDPATFVAAAGILSTIALLSAWLPARRAAQLDPVAVLRVG